jgi:WD40 repeat protein
MDELHTLVEPTGYPTHISAPWEGKFSAVSPDGQWVVGIGKDGRMSWTLVESKRTPAPWEGKLYAMSPDGQWVVAVGEEHRVDVWKVTRVSRRWGKVKRANRYWGAYFGHRRGVYNCRWGEIEALAWLNKELVLSKSADGSLHLWHAPSCTWRRTLVDAGGEWPKGWSSMKGVVRALRPKLARRARQGTRFSCSGEDNGINC